MMVTRLSAFLVVSVLVFSAFCAPGRGSRRSSPVDSVADSAAPSLTHKERPVVKDVFINTAVRDAFMVLSLRVDDLCDVETAAGMFADVEAIVDVAGVIASKLGFFSKTLRSKQVTSQVMHLSDANLLLAQVKPMVKHAKELADLLTKAAKERGRYGAAGRLEASELRREAKILQKAFDVARSVVQAQAKRDKVDLMPEIELGGTPVASRPSSAESAETAKSVVDPDEQRMELAHSSVFV